MNNDRMERGRDIARGAAETMADFEEGDSADMIYDKAFVAAHDALLERNYTPQEASAIAREVAQEIAQP